MDASTPVTIYISAAPDLRVERDMLARTIAELPISLAWRIQQTPAEGESVDRESLRQAEVHILIMGGDIRAPVGLEHDIVQHVGRPAFAFLKRDVIRTPAGSSPNNPTSAGGPLSTPGTLAAKFNMY